MGHFAKVNKDNIVTQVIVTEWDFLDANPQLLQEGEKWVRTSYNTQGGVHLIGDNIPLRKNYAGIGFTYDEQKNAFIPPKPYNSWVLNEETCLWEAPVPFPQDTTETLVWDENTLNWVPMTY
jgi:hypothetical protein